jgi:hypothetical protein
MATEHKGNMIRDIPPDGKPLTNVLPEGDLLANEGPEGDPLWKKKKKLNEDEGSEKMLNE